MAGNSNWLSGVVVGLGAAATGFYLYKKNQSKVDEWLQSQGINFPSGSSCSASEMSVEELVREKERLEDLIAEKEAAGPSK
jgi:hypothetical protein